MKLVFHPGTDMAQAMAETVGYVNRSRAFMPPGTVPPFIMRFDTGSVPVGYLVLSSETKTVGPDPGPGAVQGPADVRGHRGGVGPAAVRRQPADGRGPGRPGPAAGLRPVGRPGGAGPGGREHHRPVRATSASRSRCRSCRRTRWSSSPAELGDIEVKPGVYLRDVCRRDPVTGRAADRRRQRHRHRLRPGERQAGRLHPRSPSGPTPAPSTWSTERPGEPAGDAGRQLPGRHQGGVRVRPVALRHELDAGGGRSRGCWRPGWSG